MKSIPVRIAALLPLISAVVSAKDLPYAPDWADVAPKRVIPHPSSDGDSLVRAVAALRDVDAVDTLIDFVGARPRELADLAIHALVELTREDFGTAERRWRAWYTAHRHESRRRWLLLALTHRDRALRAAAADELADDGVALMGYLPDAPAGERHEALVRLYASLREPLPS